jgi:hypothetical protein
MSCPLKLGRLAALPMPGGQRDQAVRKRDGLDPLYVDVTGEVHMGLLSHSSYSFHLGFVQSDSGAAEKLQIQKHFVCFQASSSAHRSLGGEPT